MARRSQRLDGVLMLARNSERQAATALATAQANLSRQELTAKQLTDHQGDMLASSQPGAKLSAGDMKGQFAFQQRLSAAFQQQQQAIAQAQRQVEQARQHWLKQKARLQSLEKAQARWQQDEARDSDRREQALLDDLPKWRY
jgi:flagellar export protein FliJ